MVFHWFMLGGSRGEVSGSEGIYIPLHLLRDELCGQTNSRLVG